MARVLRFTRTEGTTVTRVNVPYEAAACWVEEETRHAPLSEGKRKGKADE